MRVELSFRERVGTAQREIVVAKLRRITVLDAGILRVLPDEGRKQDYDLTRISDLRLTIHTE